jgi:DNA-binding NarL/FixJ family response regulator
LLDEAAELDVELRTILRELLPGAVLCAINEDDTIPDLRTIRARAMKIVAPRAASPRPTRDKLQSHLVAPLRGSSQVTPSDDDVVRNSSSAARAATRAAEAAALDNLMADHLVGEMQSLQRTLPSRQRQILQVYMEWVLTKGVSPTSTDIGTLLGISPSTVRVQLRRMRMRVAKVRGAPMSEGGQEL